VGEKLKTAFCTGTYETFPIPLKDVLKRIADAGYRNVEIGVTSHMPVKTSKKERADARAFLDSYSLEVASLHRVYPAKLSIISTSASVRKAAIKYTKQVLKLASDLRAAIIVVGRRDQELGVPFEKSKKWALQAMNECKYLAEDLSVILGFEALNRYETAFINRIEDAVKFAKEINSEAVKIVADTYHMNIEEVNFSDPLVAAGKQLAHIHFADSNRQAPGMGHVNFSQVMEGLRKSGYNGCLSMEIAPIPDPDTAARKSLEFVQSLSA